MQNIINIISTIAVTFSITGNVLVNNRYKYGFIAWIISNIVWFGIELASVTPNKPRLCQLIIYTVLAIHGYFKWAKKAEAEKKAEAKA